MGDNAAFNKIDIRWSELPTPTLPATQLERRLNDCREICLDRLSKSLGSVLDKASRTFWDLADRARDRELRDLYIEGRVNAHTQREHIESEFRARYLAEFEVRIRGEKRAAFDQFDASALELGLVNDADLEENLDINDMVAKLRRDCEHDLARLEQTLAAIAGDSSLQGERNPFGPQALCHALKLTCRALEPRRKLRLVLVDLIGEHVLHDIRSLYQELNTALEERSVPPRTGDGMLRRPLGSAAAARAGAAATAAATGLPAALPARAAGAGDEKALRVVPRAATASVGDRSASGVQPALGAPVQPPASSPAPDTAAMQVAQNPHGAPQGEPLIASLTRIQRGDLTALTGGDPALTARLATPQRTNVLRELRGTSLAGGLGHIESAMLDIVALLFDQILASREIPPRMKELIGRLQIPILKVAILDNSFLCVKTHPARKLLDCMDDIVVSLDGDLDESSPLYGQLQSAARELLDGFEDSMDIFARLHDELEEFLAAQNRPAEKQVRRAAKRIEYRERLALAKAVAQQEIVQRASSGSMPGVVLRFLTEHWVKVMLVAHAKHGDGSEAWNKAVATMDLLIWSVRPKHSLAERRTLAGVLPRLLRRLNIGTRDLGIEDDDRRRFFARLMRCHTNAMNPVQSTPDNDDTEPAAGRVEFSALTMRNPFGEGDIEIEEISLSELSAGGGAALYAGRAGTAMRGDGYSRVASTLIEGTWIDFRDELGSKRRARLAYISPLRRTYVFVGARSGNVREYSLDRLASEFRAGRANVVETRSLFDQAMSGLAGAQRSSAALH